MKNKVEDVRNHLVAMMEEIGDKNAGDEALERAKTMSQLAGAYVQAVKVEIDAIRLLDDTGRLPSSVSEAPIAGKAAPRLASSRA